jgi:type IV secretory pathway VirB10-like protein
MDQMHNRLSLHPTPPATGYNRLVLYGMIGAGALAVVTYLTVMASRHTTTAKWERPERLVMVNRPLVLPADKPPPRYEPPPQEPSPPLPLPQATIPAPRPQAQPKPDPDVQRRKEALLKALSAKVLVEEFSADRPPSQTTPVALHASSPVEGPPQALEIPSAWSSSPGAESLRAWPRPPEPQAAQALVGRQQQFWQQSSDATTGQYLPAQVQPPRSPYQVNAGTIVPAVLTQALTSDLEGTLTAVVSRDVYDSVTGRFLLIPQGAKLFGVYDADLRANQPRLHVAAKTLYFPNGYSLALSGMPGSDSRGLAGLSDQVNRHFLQRYGTAAVLSLITAGVSLAVHQHNGFYTYEPEEAAIYGAGTVLGRAVAEDLRQAMQIRPTVTVREGYPFLLTVTQDIVLPGPYPFDQQIAFTGRE